MKKTTREIKEPTSIKVEGFYYFISGPDNVFLLNSDPSIDFFSRELTPDEIHALPVVLLYTGKPEHFETDHKKAFGLLTIIIYNMNEMQESHFHSFPLASFVTHPTGHLYNLVMDVQNGYVTCITVSGSGNTCRTGKSLMTAMWQIIFDGSKSQEQGISITQSALFSKLDRGIPYYSKYLLSVI